MTKAELFRWIYVFFSGTRFELDHTTEYADHYHISYKAFRHELITLGGQLFELRHTEYILNITVQNDSSVFVRLSHLDNESIKQVHLSNLFDLLSEKKAEELIFNLDLLYGKANDKDPS